VSSFWWRDIMSLSDNFFMMASYTSPTGNTIYLWRDTWNLGVLQRKIPQLYSFTLNKNISAQAFRNGNIHRLFWLPLSMEASSQLSYPQHLLNDLQWNSEDNDKWSWDTCPATVPGPAPVQHLHHRSSVLELLGQSRQERHQTGPL
jgi:hypothetical protein